jgi:hypothetical protein
VQGSVVAGLDRVCVENEDFHGVSLTPRARA